MKTRWKSSRFVYFFKENALLDQTLNTEKVTLLTAPCTTVLPPPKKTILLIFKGSIGLLKLPPKRQLSIWALYLTFIIKRL